MEGKTAVSPHSQPKFATIGSQTTGPYEIVEFGNKIWVSKTI